MKVFLCVNNYVVQILSARHVASPVRLAFVISVSRRMWLAPVFPGVGFKYKFNSLKFYIYKYLFRNV